jgi:hypothetical protein
MLRARRAIDMMDQRPTRDRGFVDLSSGLGSESHRQNMVGIAESDQRGRRRLDRQSPDNRP